MRRSLQNRRISLVPQRPHTLIRRNRRFPCRNQALWPRPNRPKTAVFLGDFIVSERSKGLSQCKEVTRAIIGESSMLDVAPDSIGRIEFRGVGWEGLDRQTGLLGE